MRKNDCLIQETLINRGNFSGTLLHAKGTIFKPNGSGACEEVAGEKMQKMQGQNEEVYLARKNSNK